MSLTYFNENETISAIIEYNYNTKADANSFNIAYGIDKNFLYGCGSSIASILLNNNKENLAFHVFTDYFGDAERAKFDALARQYQSCIKIYIVDCEKLKSFPSTKNWSYATYFRFIIADYFATKTNKVLYLDADIICQGSIHELIELTFDDTEIAAVVMEGEEEWWAKRATSLCVPALSTGYFNAGFLLIHIPQWTKAKISEQAVTMLSDPKVTAIISHLDQDVLNMILVGRVRFIHEKYNTRFSINYELKESFQNPINEETVLIHYIGPTKPWHNWANYPVSDSFIKAKEASPWSSDELLKPENSNQSRYSAKHHFKQGNFKKGITSYIRYYYYKFLEKNKACN